MASESLLDTVARHETALIESLEGAREEARQLIEAAHAESAALLQESGAKLDAEIGALRRDAALAREAVRSEVERASAGEVERIRSESAARTHEVRRELVARILPGNA